MGRKLVEGEIVELDNDTADFFIKNNLGQEHKSAKPKKRARNSRGHWKADDPSTEINEAYDFFDQSCSSPEK